jgi:hypothetical protein
MKRVVFVGGLGWLGWKCYRFNSFLNKHYEIDDFDLYLAKERPGLVVGKPAVTRRNYEVVYGPFGDFWPPWEWKPLGWRLVNMQVEKEWSWEKPKMTLRVRRRSDDKESQVVIKD